MRKTGPPKAGSMRFYGSATIGERGQIVIPAEARKKLGINKGDKLLIFAHPFKEGIMIFPVGEMESMMLEMVQGLAEIQEELKKQ